MAIIKDQRGWTNSEREVTSVQPNTVDDDGVISYVLATDQFMGQWGRDIGKFAGRSLYAVPCRDQDQIDKALANMRRSSEMTRPRVVDGFNAQIVRRDDHLSIAPWDSPWTKYTEVE